MHRQQQCGGEGARCLLQLQQRRLGQWQPCVLQHDAGVGVAAGLIVRSEVRMWWRWRMWWWWWLQRRGLDVPPCWQRSCAGHAETWLCTWCQVLKCNSSYVAWSHSSLMDERHQLMVWGTTTNGSFSSVVVLLLWLLLLLLCRWLVLLCWIALLAVWHLLLMWRLLSMM